MNQELFNFFKDTIGFDGKTWNRKHEGNAYDHAWFLHDMEEMINAHVGYPSLLHLMNLQAYLGYCANFDKNWKIPNETRDRQKEFENAGKKDDFIFFCNKFLYPINEKYKDDGLTTFLFDTLRHRLSHVYYITHILTTFDFPKDHLTIKEEGGKKFLFVSVGTLFNETKLAIEVLFKELEADKASQEFFIIRQKLLDDFATLIDQNYLRGQKLTIEPLDNWVKINSSIKSLSGSTSAKISTMPGVSANFPKTPEEVEREKVEKLFKNI